LSIWKEELKLVKEELDRQKVVVVVYIVEVLDSDRFDGKQTAASSCLIEFLCGCIFFRMAILQKVEPKIAIHQY